MELGESIAQLRKEKNVSIKELCANYLSRSAYTRFVNGETDTSATNLLFFLDRLQTSFTEFMLIKNDYQLSDSEKIMINIQNAYFREDFEYLEVLEKECDFLSCGESDRYNHLSLLSKIFQQRIQNYEMDPTVVDQLKKYLVGVDTWTHYEITLFNNSIFAYDIEFIDSVVRRATNGLERYNAIRGYTSDSFGMLCNVLTLYLSSKELHKANILFNVMKSTHLTENLVKERLYLTFYQGIVELIIQKDMTGKNKIDNSLNICDYLNLVESKKSMTKLFSLLCQLYEIPAQ